MTIKSDKVLSKGEITWDLTCGCTMHGNARLWMSDDKKRIKVTREGGKCSGSWIRAASCMASTFALAFSFCIACGGLSSI